MKRSTKAAILSLIVPGAGLWYCGRRGLAITNFLVAIAVPAIGLTMGFLAEHIQWVFLAVSAASAGLAHAMAGYKPDSEKMVH